MKFEIFVEFCPNHEFQVTGYLQKRWMIIYTPEQKSFKKLKIPRNVFNANTLVISLKMLGQSNKFPLSFCFRNLIRKLASVSSAHILSLSLTARKFKLTWDQILNSRKLANYIGLSGKELLLFLFIFPSFRKLMRAVSTTYSKFTKKL